MSSVAIKLKNVQLQPVAGKMSSIFTAFAVTDGDRRTGENDRQTDTCCQ